MAAGQLHTTQSVQWQRVSAATDVSGAAPANVGAAMVVGVEDITGSPAATASAKQANTG